MSCLLGVGTTGLGAVRQGLILSVVINYLYNFGYVAFPVWTSGVSTAMREWDEMVLKALSIQVFTWYDLVVSGDLEEALVCPGMCTFTTGGILSTLTLQ